MAISRELVENDNQSEAALGRSVSIIKLTRFRLLQRTTESILQLPIKLRVLLKPAGVANILEPKLQYYAGQYVTQTITPWWTGFLLAMLAVSQLFFQQPSVNSTDKLVRLMAGLLRNHSLQWATHNN